MQSVRLQEQHLLELVKRLFMVGYGTGNVDRHNLFSVTVDGNAHVSGTVYMTGATDFAEFFESSSGERIPAGTPVVFDNGRKIRPALSGESPFGVISKTAAFIGNSGEDEWAGKYERNADGSIIWETYEETEEVPVLTKKEITIKREVIDYTKSPPQSTRIEEKNEIEVPETIIAVCLNEKGEEIERKEVPRLQRVTRQAIRKKISPLYDHTQTYIPRIAREEWLIVGLVGVVKIIKGSPVNERWIKVEEEEEGYELWSNPL